MKDTTKALLALLTLVSIPGLLYLVGIHPYVNAHYTSETTTIDEVEFLNSIEHCGKRGSYLHQDLVFRVYYMDSTSSTHKVCDMSNPFRDDLYLVMQSYQVGDVIQEKSELARIQTNLATESVTGFTVLYRKMFK